MQMSFVRFVLVLMFFFVSSMTAATQTLQGAGATFPYPLYIKMFTAYYKQHGVKVNYQGIGSGGGIRQLKAKTVDFGATDAFITNQELAKNFDSNPVLHIPICTGGVSLTYHLPGVPTLNLTAEVIAAMYQGNIRRWNNPAIQVLNPGVPLPKLMVTPVYRSDASGTTAIFTDFLSQRSPVWKKQIGVGKTLAIRTGLAGKGNAGVAGLIKKIKGSIGYTGSVYATQNKMKTAAIRNKHGVFVQPTLAAITASVSEKIPTDTRVSLVDTSAKQGYPISGFTWIVVYKDVHVPGLKPLLQWMVTEGQATAPTLNYAPLSSHTQTLARQLIMQLPNT